MPKETKIGKWFDSWTGRIISTLTIIAILGTAGMTVAGEYRSIKQVGYNNSTTTALNALKFNKFERKELKLKYQNPDGSVKPLEQWTLDDQEEFEELEDFKTIYKDQLKLLRGK